MTRDPEPLDPRSPRLRIAFVPGVTPDKWARLWRERVRVPLEIQPVADQDQLAVLRDDAADMCLVRLPVDTFGLSVIPLYSEVPVVVAEKEHPVSAYDEVAVEDLADEHLLQPPESVPEWRDIATEVRDGTRYEVPYLSPGELFESIGAGAGIAIVPMLVARLHNRKDVIYRPVTGVAESQIGLAWLTEATDPRIEDRKSVV